jgi:hypothetical protein
LLAPARDLGAAEFGRLPIPRDGEVDSLTEAEAVFVPAKSKKTDNKKTKEPDLRKADRPTTKRRTGKKQDAA